MFTGIVEELGQVLSIEDLGDAARLAVRGPLVTSDAVHGASIAVNGVCLTVTDDSIEGSVFHADVMAETLKRSSLGVLKPGDPVNLERPVSLASRLGGHLVQGHVDGVGSILSRTPGEHWEVVEIAMSRDIAPYVVEKGSITVDGVSLTVVGTSGEPDNEDGHSFSVSLIPTTLDLTTLGHKGIGDPVNLEVDVIAKYVERIALFRTASGTVSGEGDQR